MKDNVIILTNGLCGSSVLLGLSQPDVGGFRGTSTLADLRDVHTKSLR
jgi:hypothetical protein